MDTKKKELVGRFRNAGREWQKKGEPDEVLVYDFIDLGEGKASPYGVYDLGRNEAWVNVGTDHDTPQFAVESLRRWWKLMGRRAYPAATELLITADGGGSNGYRPRLWKSELQRFCNQTGLAVTVLHFPPGTSKWNKIEHRLFCHITRNWRGRSLESYDTIVRLIGSTTTRAGLKVRARLDTNHYPTGIVVTKAEMAAVNLSPHDFQGEWNYTLRPRAPTR